MRRTLGMAYGGYCGRTSCCTIQWLSQIGMVETPRFDVLDKRLLDEIQAADWTGIANAPFGWPDAFLHALNGYSVAGFWPRKIKPDLIRYRTTDRFVRDTLATDHARRVNMTPATSHESTVAAWRCAQLLTDLAALTDKPLDRIVVPLSTGLDGGPDAPRGTLNFPTRGVVEVHVPAALAMWGLSYFGYKDSIVGDSVPARARREEILQQLEAVADSWLFLGADARRMMVACDDAFEAFFAALIACATSTDATIKPTLEQRGAAQREGWIHLPVFDSLENLAPA